MSQRDKNLFLVFVRKHTPMLLTYISTVIEDPATVDDLFQETMIVAWRRFDDHDLSYPSGQWLRAIARRLILAHYRRLGRGPVYCNESVLSVIDERMATIAGRRGDAWDDKVKALDSCMERLPQSLQRSIELFYRDNLKTEEIAAQMNSSREGIKKRLQRARDLLADCLRGKGVF